MNVLTDCRPSRKPLLVATGDAERSSLESDLVAEAEGFLETFLGSSFFSTHSGEEEAFFDFLAFLG